MSFLRHREIYPSDGGADFAAGAPFRISTVGHIAMACRAGMWIMEP